MKLDNNNHSVFMLHYHLIMCVKYRNKVINDKISARLKEIFWSQSFCLLTTGGATVDIIKQYIQSQGKKDDKQSH